MYYGKFFYQFIYIQQFSKVCIFTADRIPAMIELLTLEDCRKQASRFQEVCILYTVALDYFPKEIL